jgi:imidazolonepropionase
MQLMLSLACIKMKMTPEEVINASTINTAFALELSESLGTITPGKIANVFITKPMPSYAYMPYHMGNNMVDRVILNGKLV